MYLHPQATHEHFRVFRLCFEKQYYRLIHNVANSEGMYSTLMVVISDFPRLDEILCFFLTVVQLPEE